MKFTKVPKVIQTDIEMKDDSENTIEIDCGITIAIPKAINLESNSKLVEEVMPEPVKVVPADPIDAHKEEEKSVDISESENQVDLAKCSELLFNKSPYLRFSLGLTPDDIDFPKVDAYGIHNEDDSNLIEVNPDIKLSKWLEFWSFHL